MLINVFRVTRLENFAEKPEPRARLDAHLRKTWSTLHVLLRLLRCAPGAFYWCLMQILVNPHIHMHLNAHRALRLEKVPEVKYFT